MGSKAHQKKQPILIHGLAGVGGLSKPSSIHEPCQRKIQFIRTCKGRTIGKTHNTRHHPNTNQPLIMMSGKGGGPLIHKLQSAVRSKAARLSEVGAPAMIHTEGASSYLLRPGFSLLPRAVQHITPAVQPHPRPVCRASPHGPVLLHCGSNPLHVIPRAQLRLTAGE